MSVLDIDQSWNFWKLGWNQTLHKKFVLCTYLLMYLNNIRYAMEKDDESEEWYSCQSWILEISRKCQKMLLGKDWKGNHSNRICRLFWRASRQTEKLWSWKGTILENRQFLQAQ